MRDTIAQLATGVERTEFRAVGYVLVCGPKCPSRIEDPITANTPLNQRGARRSTAF